MIDPTAIRNEYRAGGTSHRKLARKYHTSVGTVGRILRGVPVGNGTPAKADNVIYIQPQPVHVEPLPTLDSLSDRERWQHDLNDLLHSKRFITVIHRADVHNPYSDPAAVALWDELAAVLKPDVVVRGSDEDDLPTISVYVQEHGETVPDVEDFLDLMYMNRRADTMRVKRAAPSALQVNIEGNHGYGRFKPWVNKQASASATTLHRRYIENIRCNGDVYFIGFKRSVRISELIVAHGRRYGANAPKQTLQDRNFHWSILAGHSHKPGLYTSVGKYPVTCVISGCLAQIPAHYDQEEDDDFSLWQHGTAYATIDTKTGVVDAKEIRFNRSGNLMWFELGGKIYAHEIEQAADAEGRAA